MKEWKALLSINLSLALLLGAVCPVAYAEEESAEVLPVEESVPAENAGDPRPAEEAGESIYANTVGSDNYDNNNDMEVALAGENESAEETTAYIFVCSYEVTESNLSNSSDYAVVISQDGVMSTVSVRQGDSIGEGAIEQDTACVNKWYEYSLDENDIYTLNAAADTQLIDVNRGIIDRMHASVGDSSQHAYGNSSSVYLMVTAEENCGDAVCSLNERISEVASVTTGIQNTLIHATGNVYALFDANGYVVCAIVVGEPGENAGTPGYLISEAKTITYDSIGKYYVYSYDAIVDGDITTIEEKVTDEESVNASPHTLYILSYDEEGYVESKVSVSLETIPNFV